ncbi:MAG: GntP family permease [Bacteroidota bacterium]|nr:GntP family permease [Bacteroidota bacterium]
MHQLFIILVVLVIAISGIVILTSKYKIHAFYALLVGSVIVGLLLLPSNQIVPALKSGFGHTMQSIGIIIILGTAIGIALDKTGATISMANFILSKIGEKKAPIAILITGFIVGLPIFCDSGFIVLSGLNNALALRTGIPITFMAPVLGVALYSVHCLIPPHPGAAAAAGILQVNMGPLMLIGILIAIPTAFAGYLWIKYRSKVIVNQHVTKNQEVSQPDLPGAFHSLLPILIPILLLTIKSIADLVFKHEGNFIFSTIALIGDPVFALMIGLIIALTLINRSDKDTFRHVLTDSIEKAGPILAVIAAGGAFGYIIKETGIGQLSGSHLSATGLGLFIPFIITALLKTAQGSSTVAIITTASIIAPMLEALNLDTETGKLFTVLSMGAGSMFISHANDAYFWVITRFSNIDQSDTLRLYTTASIVMGIVAFAFILGFSFLF